MSKQISSDSFKNKITNKLFTSQSYRYKHLTVCKQMSFGLFKMLHTKYSLINHIFDICMNKIWHYITYEGWYAIKPKKTPKRLMLN